MRRSILMLLLVFVSSSAWAEWTNIGKTDDETIYLDVSTIRRSGNLVRVWVLWDYKTMQTNAGLRFLSTKDQDQYDCQEENRRALAFTAFSQNMGRGDVVHTDSDPGKWSPVVPESIGEHIFKIVCDKKREDNEAKRTTEAVGREEERKLHAAAMERERQQQEAARKQREAEDIKRRAEASSTSAQQKLLADWKARIQTRIKNRVVVPPNMEGNPEARFEVVLLPGGEVLSATLRKSSGNRAYDAAVERAIMAAQPLPVPTETDLFQENFQELTLVFRPKD